MHTRVKCFFFYPLTKIKCPRSAQDPTLILDFLSVVCAAGLTELAFPVLPAPPVVALPAAAPSVLASAFTCVLLEILLIQTV